MAAVAAARRRAETRKRAARRRRSPRKIPFCKLCRGSAVDFPFLPTKLVPSSVAVSFLEKQMIFKGSIKIMFYVVYIIF